MQPKPTSSDKTFELKKHVGLIHSTNRLTLLERKIANALLYNAYSKLATHNEHVIHIPYMCELIGYNSKDYKTIKSSLISLISTVLEWNLVSSSGDPLNDQTVWVASTMLSDAKIESSTCTYSYSNRMRELCFYPEYYGRLNMHVLSRFKSTYGIALYENCIRYQNINQTPWFDLITYKKLMGVENGKYKVFRDLNLRVLKPAVKEVNNYSHISVTPEVKKEGRGVSAVRFLINKKVNKLVETSLNNKNSSINAESLVREYGFSEARANSLLAKYDKQYILEKITIMVSSLPYKNGKIKCLASYLLKALEDNFQASISSSKHLEKLQLNCGKDFKEAQASEEKITEYRRYQNKELQVVLNNVSEKEKMAIEKAFMSYIRPTVYNNLYLKEGLNNPLLQDRFGDFARARELDILKSLVSFEDFCKEGT